MKEETLLTEKHYKRESYEQLYVNNKTAQIKWTNSQEDPNDQN